MSEGDFGRAAQKVEEIRESLEDELMDALARSMADVAWQLRAELYKQDSVASANLWESIDVERTSGYTNLTARGVAISAAPYWKYVEYGTGIYSGRGYKAASPGPPYDDIYEWVVAKGITPRPDGPAETQEELAGAIQNSLSLGTQQHRFARPVWRSQRGKDHVEREVKKAVTKAIHSI